ncbi:MAG TPA: asparaginase [Micromonosporaceae bacterium]
MTSVVSKRRVVVFALGGTIAMTADPRGGVVPTLSGQDLLAGVPGLVELGVEVEVEEFRRIPAGSLSFADLHGLSAAIDSRLAAGADGVVVIQGTNTIEETAYLVDLTHRHDAPVVFTGAMRNPTLAGPDGPANLLAAVATAAHPACRGLGCLVVFADEIHAAAQVRKSHTMSVAAFTSPNTGPLGHLVEGVPRILTRPAHRYTVPGRPVPGRSPRVALMTVTLGDEGESLPATADLDGLVVAAFGVGHVPERLLPELTAQAARIPVVYTSRTNAGSTATGTYGFPGSERDLIARGLIPAGFVDPVKARLLLYTLLRHGIDRSGVAEAFAAAGTTAAAGA